MRIHARRIAAASLVLMLAGCGGGGSGGSEGTSGTGTQFSASGLIPTAPPAGATLYADATVLRPMRTGTVSRYSGVRTAYTGASPQQYDATLTQEAAGPTGATETLTNSINSDVQTLKTVISGGQVLQQELVNFTGKGAPQLVNVIALKSPVRVGDQYVSVDERFTDTAIDADSDGKTDELFVAMYSRVVGIETLTLPNLPPLKALRVDTVTASRVAFSSTGRYSELKTASQKSWYAPGVGIVRQLGEFPSLWGPGLDTSEEQLASWDGLTKGLGAMPAVFAKTPAATDFAPAQTSISVGRERDVRTAAFGDHALVLVPYDGSPRSTWVSRLDLRGNVQSTTRIENLYLPVDEGVMTSDATGIVVLQRHVGVSPNLLDVTRLDSKGALVGAVRGVTLADFTGRHSRVTVRRFAAALDDGTLWVLFQRSYDDITTTITYGDEVVLRPFGLDGMPVGPEQIVDSVRSNSLRMVAAGGRVLMSWAQAGTYELMFATSTAQGLTHKQTLLRGTGREVLTPATYLTKELGALMWHSDLGLSDWQSESALSTGGVLLNANSELVMAGPNLIEERIPGIPQQREGVPEPAALGSRIVVATTTRQQGYTPDGYPAPRYDSVSWLDTGTAPLSQTPVSTVQFLSQNAFAQIVFPDRVLVLGSYSSYGSGPLSTTVVWLNRGD
jgi:hypothetical protein